MPGWEAGETVIMNIAHIKIIFLSCNKEAVYIKKNKKKIQKLIAKMGYLEITI